MGKEAIRPLLATKLLIPPLRSNLVTRPRLLKKLDYSQDPRLILITAPAGFGKTTLASCWLTRRHKRAAWLSLDEADNALPVFIAYIVAALQQIGSGICATTATLLRSDEPPAIDILLPHLINDLACLKERIILVLDDYHLITAQEIHQALDFILENAPPTLKLIVISRHTPPVAIPRLRARNELVELSTIDLSFTLDETRLFFSDIMQIPLEDDEIAQLQQRTAGWVTGLQLAALGLKEQPDRAGFVQAFTGDDRYVADYLVDEVLAQQPAEIYRFLVQTSILNRFNASLCNTVLGIENALEILLKLEKTNLFLIPLDNRRSWYQYHHLFGEMLYGRLQTISPELITPLYQKTVKWHLANGLMEEAIEYALAGQDYEQAVSLIKKIIFDLRDSNQRHLTIKWIEQLPLTLVKANRILWIQYILAQFYYSNFFKAHAFLEQLQLLPANHRSANNLSIDQAHAFPLLAAIVLHTTIDANQARELNRQALAHLPEDTRLLKGIAIGHNGTANFLLGNLNEAKADLLESVRLIEGSRSWSLIFVFNGYLAELVARQGKLRQAARMFRELQDAAFSHGLHESTSLTFSIINHGLLHYEWNDLVEAEELIRAGERQAKPGAPIDRLLPVVQALVKTNQAVGAIFDISEKLRWIEQLAQKYGNPPFVISRLNALRAFLALEQGDLAQSAQWARDFKQNHQGIAIFQQFEWMTVARIWLAIGDEKASIQILRALQTLAQKEGCHRDYIEISVWLIIAYHQNGEETRALHDLSSVLQAAEPEGYVRTFVDAGELIKQLLVKLLASNGRSVPQHSSTSYIQHILTAFPESFPSATQPVVESLTPRELEILQLLAAGMTYAQIAETLTITTNTLKTHIKHIYSKFNVHNRVQAIFAGRDAGILTD